MQKESLKMATENIKERVLYRVLTDEKSRVWERCNFVTSARSVDADNGENLETKVGAIKGITTSSTVTEEGWVPDAASVNARLNVKVDRYDEETKTLYLVSV